MQFSMSQFKTLEIVKEVNLLFTEEGNETWATQRPFEIWMAPHHTLGQRGSPPLRAAANGRIFFQLQPGRIRSTNARTPGGKAPPTVLGLDLNKDGWFGGYKNYN